MKSKNKASATVNIMNSCKNSKIPPLTILNYYDAYYIRSILAFVGGELKPFIYLFQFHYLNRVFLFEKLRYRRFINIVSDIFQPVYFDTPLFYLFRILDVSE